MVCLVAIGKAFGLAAATQDYVFPKPDMYCQLADGWERFAISLAFGRLPGNAWGFWMTFAYEQDMAAPASAWLASQKLLVKREFPTPWGVCDLVGCSLNGNKVRKRLILGQRKALRSQLRVHVLSLIPDRSEGRAVSLDELHRRFGGHLDRGRIEQELEKLIEGRFVEQIDGQTYSRHNRWMPLHKRLVAVELKLVRTDDAFVQAVNNLGFADESYVALPADRARRLAKSKSRSAFTARGIGLLAVGPDDCRVVLKARPMRRHADSPIQHYCVERFWQPHIRGGRP